MKTLIHGIGGDAEHLGHIGDRKLFPCHEPEDFGVGAAETCCCLEHEPTLVGLDGRLVDSGQRSGTCHRPHAVTEPTTAGRAAPLVTDDAVGDPIQPQQGLVAGGYVVDASPRRQEDLRNGVIDSIGRQSTPAVAANRPEMALVQLSEQHVVAGVDAS